MTISIPLFAVKTKLDLGRLTYRKLPIANIQRRLAGRYALEPEIALNDYSCRAVIDWLSLGRETQHQWLQHEVKAVLGKASHIKALEEKPGGVSDQFEIRVQEPQLDEVRRLCERVQGKFGLRAPPVVGEIEISVDFTPKTPDDVARAKLFQVLTHHFQPPRDVIAHLRDRPRFAFGTGAAATVGVLGYSRVSCSKNDHFLILTTTDRLPYVDATYYVGSREAGSRWRIMDKVVDRQNRSAGTQRYLADAEKRVRIEVTFSRQELAAMNLNHLADLRTFSFSRLQAKAFIFVLPTFGTREVGLLASISAWKDRRRTEKFSKAGVVGLKTMDDALDRQRETIRSGARSDFRQRGLTMKPLPRFGKGASGTSVAYQEMNERVGVALRHLGERVAASFSC